MRRQREALQQREVPQQREALHHWKKEMEEAMAMDLVSKTSSCTARILPGRAGYTGRPVLARPGHGRSQMPMENLGW